MHSVGDPGPFRGRKRSLYEGGVRMPFIVRWPGVVPAGRVSPDGVISADWLPTVAALAGVTFHGVGLMGHDVSGLLVPARGPPAARLVPRMWDYRADGYGYCWNQAPRLAIRDWVHPELKLLMNPDGSRLEVYNLSQSTFEAAVNIPASSSDAARMSRRLLQWSQRCRPLPFRHITSVVSRMLSLRAHGRRRRRPPCLRCGRTPRSYTCTPCEPSRFGLVMTSYWHLHRLYSIQASPKVTPLPLPSRLTADNTRRVQYVATRLQRPERRCCRSYWT